MNIRRYIFPEPRVLSRGFKWLLATTLFLSINAGVSWAAQPEPDEHKTDLVVYKVAQCGCCTEWIDQLEHSGLSVDVVEVFETDSLRSRLGVPRQLASCHTAVAGDYWIEGHVPIDLVRQLLEEQPEDIRGIAVPGMPAGSPGMESPAPVEYDVLSVDHNGNVEVFATRMGKAIRQD